MAAPVELPARVVARSGVPAYVWFTAPALAFYAVFFVFPTATAFWLGTYGWSGLGEIKPFVGLANFGQIITSAAFFRAASHNVAMFAGIFVLQNTVSLGLALLLNRSSPWAHIYRAIIFLPVITSAVATGFIWDTLLSPNIGAINPFLRDVGLGSFARNWLADPALALAVVTLIQFWQWNGIAVVLYLAGLQGVPEELRQAARIDGADGWLTFLHVTFPLLAPAFTVLTVLSFIIIFRSFDLVYVLGGPTGSPDGATSVLGTLIYSDAFGIGGSFGSNMHMSYGIAEGVLLFVIVATISGVLLTLLGRRERDLQ
ncbi:MAG: carbohydrate ABC transporter permease [Chloroflexota bacterium]